MIGRAHGLYLDRGKIDCAQNTTWEWTFLFTDNDDTPVDMTSGFTGDATIRDAATGGTEIVAPTVTFPAAGSVLLTVTPAANTSLTPGIHYGELRITRTSDGKKLLAFGAGDTKVTIKAKTDA